MSSVNCPCAGCCTEREHFDSEDAAGLEATSRWNASRALSRVELCACCARWFVTRVA